MTSQLLNDRYQIIRTLGSGGFGETFLAEDTHMPSRRRCVVKRLRPVEENPQINQLVRERFQREAAILEELGNGHNQIPTLYAYFYLQADRQFYLVQEWIDGDTLGTIIRQQGRLDEAEVRRILIALLPVFDYIHRKSIIHRDVKPENIILRHSDRQPVLIDFGAVRETMGAALNSQGRPTQSIVIGTPGYMASEQSIGRPVYSSDLYSLGMTAIYLLTGKQPQEFVSNPTTGEINWRSDAPQASSQLANILDRAIASHPRDRYQTANDFLSALQDTAATWVVAPGSDTKKLQPPDPEPPHRDSKLLLMGGIVVGSILGSAAMAALFLRPPETPVVTASPSITSSVINSASAPAVSPPTPTSSLDSPSASVSLTPSRSSSSIASPPTVVARTTLTPTKSSELQSYPSNPSNPSSFSSPGKETVIPSSTPATTPSAPANATGLQPEMRVSEYYQAINSRNYPAAWQMLPPDLQSSTTAHPQGYSSFTQWWDSIAGVDLVRIRTVRQGTDRALVNVRAIYRMKNGQSAPFILRYMMVWDAPNQKWSIAKISR